MSKKETAASPHPFRKGLLSSLVLTTYPIHGTSRGQFWTPFSCLFHLFLKLLKRKEVFTLHYGENTKKLSCSLKPHICKYIHLNKCQFICLIKLVFQILAWLYTVVPLPGSGLHHHMKGELLASLLDPCLFRTGRSN